MHSGQTQMSAFEWLYTQKESSWSVCLPSSLPLLIPSLRTEFYKGKQGISIKTSTTEQKNELRTSNTISSSITLAPGFGFGTEPTKEMEYKKGATEVGFKKILIVRRNHETPTKYLYSHLIHFGFYHLIVRLIF